MGGGGGRGGGGGGAPAPIIVGGLGTGDANNCGPARFGGGILIVDGVIYAASPDNVYAIDARDGTVLWHYYWKTRGGTSLRTRGSGMWHNYIYFELHDDWMVCLDSQDRQGSLEEGDRAVSTAVLLFERAHGDRQPRHRRHRQRYGCARLSSSRSIPETGDVAVDVLFHAAERRRTGHRNMGQPGRGPPRRRHVVDSRRLRSGDSSLHVSAPATPRPPTPVDAATATTSTPAA